MIGVQPESEVFSIQLEHGVGIRARTVDRDWVAVNVRGGSVTARRGHLRRSGNRSIINLRIRNLQGITIVIVKGILIVDVSIGDGVSEGASSPERTSSKLFDRIS